MATLKDLPLRFIEQLPRSEALALILEVRKKRTSIPIVAPKPKKITKKKEESLAKIVDGMTEEQAMEFLAVLMKGNRQ